MTFCLFSALHTKTHPYLVEDDEDDDDGVPNPVVATVGTPHNVFFFFYGSEYRHILVMGFWDILCDGIG